MPTGGGHEVAGRGGSDARTVRDGVAELYGTAQPAADREADHPPGHVVAVALEHDHSTTLGRQRGPGEGAFLARWAHPHQRPADTAPGDPPRPHLELQGAGVA